MSLERNTLLAVTMVGGLSWACAHAPVTTESFAALGDYDDLLVPTRERWALEACSGGWAGETLSRRNRVIEYARSIKGKSVVVLLEMGEPERPYYAYALAADGEAIMGLIRGNPEKEPLELAELNAAVERLEPRQPCMTPVGDAQFGRKRGERV